MKRWLPLFLAGAAVTAACPLPPAAAAEDAAPLVAKGRALLEKKDFAGAREAFLAAVAKDPRSLDARRGAAEVLLAVGRYDDSVSQSFAGLELVGDADAGLWLLAARAFLAKGETLPAEKGQEINDSFADAKAKASEALKRDPSLLAANLLLAKACRLTNDLERAGLVLDAALEQEPRSVELLMERGMLCLKAAKYPSALEAFSKAAEFDPLSAEARYQQGMAHAWLRENEQACACFVKAAVLDPANRRSLIGITKQGKDDAAKIRCFRDILKAKPDHAWAQAYVAYFLAYGKDEAGALAASKSAMAMQKSNPDLVAWHGQVLDILGRGEEARAWYRKSIENETTMTFPWAKLTEFALNPGSPAKQDERKACIDFMGKTRFADGLFWNNVGLVSRDVLRDYRRALDAYLKAAELSPADQGIQNDTGLIYLYHGKSIGEDQHRALPFFEATLRLVREENQDPEMGYRDTLENLAVYYMEVEKDPEKALEFAEARNDPAFIQSLPKEIAQPSGKVAAVKSWAASQLKKK